MMKRYLMAIDAGTGSVRAVLFNLEGKQLGCAQQEWEHMEDPRFKGSMDFDWRFNWQLTAGCIRDVLAQTSVDPSEIAAISTSCMREGIVLYDKEMREIWACANVDARSNNEAGRLVQNGPALQKEFYLKSGQTYALNAIPRVLWVKNNMPEIYQNMAYLSMFNDWLIYKLSGTLVSEPSNSCTTGIFDLTTRNWEPSIAERCGLRSDIFPSVLESGTAAAKVSAAAAVETGLSEGTLLVVGGGDAQLGCIGVGVTQPGQAAVFGGSFWQYEFNSATPKTDDQGCRVRVNCHAVPGIWQYEAIAFYPGLVMRWYRDAFCQLEKAQADQTGEDPYYLMDQKAAEIPAGCYGMMCAFSDVMNYIEWKHAAPTFTNFALDAEKYNRFTFYRAIMENSCMATRGNMELVRNVTGNMPTEIIFANGAAKSPLWCQILADVLGLPVKVPHVKESTALGTAILAGVGAGIYPDVSAATAKMVEIDREFLPNPASAAVYDEMYPVWRKVYAAQLSLCDQKLTRNMWIAPGL